MSVTKKDVEYVATLARLSFTENEKETLIQDLNRILTYVEKLNELNTDDVDVIVNPYYIENKYREDNIEASMLVENVLANAPELLESYILVPKILD
jgi:aspartyl-tRNA(Asn)/glutamyl-tRNA(Gln) amidotransferase subunit C